MLRLASRLNQVLAVLLLCLPAAAHAEAQDQTLARLESEARQIGTNLQDPNQPPPGAGQRKLVDAEVAYALGKYDEAALMLFELASRPGPDQERATYYLGESLFQKGDKGAARTYFTQVVAKTTAATGTPSKYYQPSLLRLVEIGIAQGDPTDLDQHLAALERSGNVPDLAYVKGKWAFSQGKHDEALQLFATIAPGSKFELQAKYFSAATLVAKKEFSRATELYTDLVTRKPKTSNDKRVVELSQLALGRLHYEQGQPGKAIDSYLLVDRRSDLFADALYEVAWVYVKGKQYDKALRALELLHLANPLTLKTPTVRILEGNLRIRKAQLVRTAQITGALDTKDGNPAAEYDKAAQVFTETHDLYMPSYLALSQMVDSTADPAQYIAQIAGRSDLVFAATAPLPDAAVMILREQPEVLRIVSIETDLGEIQANIALSESTITRLEAVLAANDRTAVYPALASRRTRIGQMQHDLIGIRNDVAEQQLRVVDSSGELASLSGARKTLMQQYAALQNPEQAYAERVALKRAQFDAIEQSTAEVSATIDSTQAMAIAVRRHLTDSATSPTPVPADQRSEATQTLDSSAKDAASIEGELVEIHRDLELGRDLAGVGDEELLQARTLRRQLTAALDAEHRALAALVGSSRDRTTSQKLTALGDRATKLAGELAATEARIDTMADRGIEQAKLVLAQERTNLVAYHADMAEQQAESTGLGATALAASLKDVKAKFYDIIIRTDVGSVDVGWSQKEDADDDLKRLSLSRQRELKQLRDEFKGIVDGGELKTSMPAPMPLPIPESSTPSGSPDKGNTDGRIKPGSVDKPAAPTPVVRPDNEQTPKGKPAKAAAPQGGTR